jgi:hypothetical protein
MPGTAAKIILAVSGLAWRRAGIATLPGLPGTNWLGQTGGMRTNTATYLGYGFPAEIISHDCPASAPLSQMGRVEEGRISGSA